MNSDQKDQSLNKKKQIWIDLEGEIIEEKSIFEDEIQSKIPVLGYRNSPINQNDKSDKLCFLPDQIHDNKMKVCLINPNAHNPPRTVKFVCATAEEILLQDAKTQKQCILDFFELNTQEYLEILHSKYVAQFIFVDFKTYCNEYERIGPQLDGELRGARNACEYTLSKVGSQRKTMRFLTTNIFMFKGRPRNYKQNKSSLLSLRPVQEDHYEFKPDEFLGTNVATGNQYKFDTTATPEPRNLKIESEYYLMVIPKKSQFIKCVIPPDVICWENESKFDLKMILATHKKGIHQFSYLNIHNCTWQSAVKHSVARINFLWKFFWNQRYVLPDHLRAQFMHLNRYMTESIGNILCCSKTIEETETALLRLQQYSRFIVANQLIFESEIQKHQIRCTDGVNVSLEVFAKKPEIINEMSGCFLQDNLKLDLFQFALEMCYQVKMNNRFIQSLYRKVLWPYEESVETNECSDYGETVEISNEI